MKLDIIELISFENWSEAKKEGNNSFNGIIMSICCEVWYMLKDCCMRMGVKNQKGSTMTRIKRTHIIDAERVWDLTIFRSQSCIGAKTTTNISPKTNGRIIGLVIRKTRTAKTTNTEVIITLLRYSSSMRSENEPNL